MAGGWIQAALLGSLSGSSIPAWRLIFVVVSVATIPFAAFGEYQGALIFFTYLKVADMCE